MPRANRHFLPNHVWHITHRCHKKEFLLKFSRDRRRWIQWLYEAKKRYGLCVLNYMVTSNHIHLLVVDGGNSVIARSMQLIAGRTAQEYNQRKGRKGAYWEDRYHATAIDTDEHLYRCLVYIDLNMVRAGVVSHPHEWTHCGYQEIQHPPKRYSIINHEKLQTLCGISGLEAFRGAHQDCVETALQSSQIQRQPQWSESLAVGSEAFINRIDDALGYRKPGRRIELRARSLALKEPEISYSINFSPENDVVS